MKTIIAIAICVPALMLSHFTRADTITVGDLTITAVEARATPPGALTSGGYLTIHNHGNRDDTLIGASVTFAAKTELHEMKMEGEVMKMRHLENGLPIPAGTEVKLESGGYHLMFMRLQQALKPGELFEGTLQFERAGKVAVKVEVHAIKGHNNQHGHATQHKHHNKARNGNHEAKP